MEQRTNCPNCGSQNIERDEVDVGVGVIYGPYGCHDCGWSADPEYDLSDPDRSQIDEKGGAFDQFGNYYPRIRFIR